MPFKKGANPNCPLAPFGFSASQRGRTEGAGKRERSREEGDCGANSESIYLSRPCLKAGNSSAQVREPKAPKTISLTSP